MRPLALYCKSYSVDLHRIVRLAQTIQRYNRDRLPFYVSVRQQELPLFREHLQDLNVELLADEDILQVSPRFNPELFHGMHGSVQQQVVKAEFWRLGLSQAYVCLDSDALFIRPFGTADFMAPDGTPYTLLDEAHDLLEDALHQNRLRVLDAYEREADQIQQLFGRLGRRYSFGPFPLVWHRSVWQSLDERYLQARGMGFIDAIAQAPVESRWYGEALLAWQAIPLLPCQALFKVYHYAWQFDRDRKQGIGMEQLSRLYCGVIYQSSWEREFDWPHEGGNTWSRLGRYLRRRLGRI